MLFLTVRADSGAIRHPLRQGQTTIGRALVCDIVINHGSVSRRHARLAVDGSRLVISDLNSSSGLFRNGERVKETSVAIGDVIWLGSIEATVEEQATAPAIAASAAKDEPTVELEQTI